MRKLEKHGRWVLPGLWRLNRTTWIARVPPRDPRTGKRVNRRRLITNATRSEAVAVLESMRREAEQPNTAATVSADCAGDGGRLARADDEQDRPTDTRRFHRVVARAKNRSGDLEETTATRYATDLGHLSKRLLRMRLDEIQPNDIELWMIAARKDGFAREHDQHLARHPSQRAQRCARSPATPQPAWTRSRSRSTSKPNSLKPEQLRKLLEALREEDRVVCAAAWMQAVTGLRWCEVSALKWEDLDGQERILVIRRKAVKGKLKPSTKTKRLRELGVPELIIDELTALRAWLDATKHPGSRKRADVPVAGGHAARLIAHLGRAPGRAQASGHHSALHLARAAALDDGHAAQSEGRPGGREGNRRAPDRRDARALLHPGERRSATGSRRGQRDAVRLRYASRRRDSGRLRCKLVNGVVNRVVNARPEATSAGWHPDANRPELHDKS